MGKLGRWIVEPMDSPPAAEAVRPAGVEEAPKATEGVAGSAGQKEVVEIPDWTPEDEVKRLEEEVSRLQATLKAVQSASNCPVCHCVLVGPHSLACGHIVCVTCLHDWLFQRLAGRQHYECPMCRASIEAPPARAYGLDGIMAVLGPAQPGTEGKEYTKRLEGATKMIEEGDLNKLFGPSYTMDGSDGVLRCGDCHFEIVESRCAGCGAEFPQLGGLHSEEDGSEGEAEGDDDDDDDGDEEGEEEEEEEGEEEEDMDGFVVDDHEVLVIGSDSEGEEGESGEEQERDEDSEAEEDRSSGSGSDEEGSIKGKRRKNGEGEGEGRHVKRRKKETEKEKEGSSEESDSEDSE